MKNIVIFYTADQPLCDTLQKALPATIVMRVENIDQVNHSVRNNEGVGAVLLHVTDSKAWTVFEMLQTGYPTLPRFALLAAASAGNELDTNRLAQKYEATAIQAESKGVAGLAPLIENIIKNQFAQTADSKTRFLALYGSVSRELLRLQAEFTETGLRTLPQTEIGEDTLERLQKSFNNLTHVRITP